MNHWSVRRMQGKPKTKNLKNKNKTSVLIPIGSPAEALSNPPSNKSHESQDSNQKSSGPMSCYQFPFGRRKQESPVGF